MKSDRDIVLISLMTFLTVLSWITFELLKTVKTSTVPSTTEELISVIKPDIDMETLTVLNNRK